MEDPTCEKVIQYRKMMQDFIYIKDGVAEEKYSSAQGVDKIKTDQQIYMIAPTLKRLSPGR